MLKVEPRLCVYVICFCLRHHFSSGDSYVFHFVYFLCHVPKWLIFILRKSEQRIDLKLILKII